MKEHSEQNSYEAENSQSDSHISAELQSIMKQRLFSVRGVYVYFDEGGEEIELLKGSKLFSISKNPLFDSEGMSPVWVQVATVTQIDRKKEEIVCEIIIDIPRKFRFDVRTGVITDGTRKQWLSLKNPLKTGMTSRDSSLLMQS